MPLQAIPGQPINITPYAQDACLGADSKQYAALYNTDDIFYFQGLNAPCGSELWCNPTFSSDGGTVVSVANNDFAANLSSWTAGANWTWDASSGAKYTYTAGIFTKHLLGQALAVTPGITYRVSFTITDYVSTTGLALFVSIGDNGGTGVSVTGNGVKTLDIVAGVTNFELRFVGSTGTDGSFVIHNVVVEEINNCFTVVDTGWQVLVGGAYKTPGTPSSLLASGYLPTAASPFGYFKFVITVENMTTGVLTFLVNNIANIQITANGTYTRYDLAPNNGDIEFAADADFDGAITYFSVFELSKDYQADILDEAGTVVMDLTLANLVTYANDRVNISFPTTGMSGCYSLRIVDTCPAATFTSNKFIVAASHECAKLVLASGSGTSLGFLWAGFALSHRVRFLSFNPEYPIDGDDYEPSDGSREITYAKKEKYYTGLVDYADENFHDTFTNQILCENFYIDGVLYFVKLQNYKPDWNKEGRNSLAQAKIELRKKTGTVYTK